MAQPQRPSQGTRSNPNLDIFIPDTFFNAAGTWNSPGMPAISANNDHGHFPPNLFRGHDENNVSARQPSDHTLQPPFSVDLGNGTNSKFRHESEELVSYLLHQASQRWETSRANTKTEVKAEVKAEVKSEIAAEMKPEITAEVKQFVEDHLNKLLPQLSRHVARQLNDAVQAAVREYL
jgi:hypothetical protein